MRILFFVLLVCVSTGLKAAPAIEVFVSILPQKYFVERIGADRVNVHVMVKPGQSPETFEPSPKIMSAYSRADVFFTIGMPFEQVWIDRVASLNQTIHIVSTQPEEPMRLQLDHHHDHDNKSEQELEYEQVHEPEQHHDDESEAKGNWDPHSWLSPVIALRQAQLILAELSHLDPDNKELFHSNYKHLKTELEKLDHDIASRFANKNKQSFLTFHPAFSYFARQYGLTQVAIEVEGREPSAKQIATIVGGIRDKKPPYILVERQFNRVIPKTIADAINARLLILDPLAYDYISNLQDIAIKIDQALY